MNTDFEQKQTKATKRMEFLKSVGENAKDMNPTHLEDRLCDMLRDDPNCVVRHEAAFLLGSLVEQKIILGVQALAALGAASADKSILVRHEVALSLAYFRHPASIRLLDKLACDQANDVADSALLAIETIREQRT